MNRTNQTNQTERTERLKSELFSSDFRHCPKSEWFDNRTILKSPKIRTFGFRHSTVYTKLKFIIETNLFFPSRDFKNTIFYARRDSAIFFVCWFFLKVAILKDPKYCLNNMSHISLQSGAKDSFTSINIAATFQYFGVPHPFSVLL